VDRRVGVKRGKENVFCCISDYRFFADFNDQYMHAQLLLEYTEQLFRGRGRT